MKPLCALVPVDPWHIEVVAANLRPADADEIWASSHATGRSALQRGVDTAIRCWTGLVDGEPVLIAGVTPSAMILGQGVPWMLATPGVERVERPFIRLCRPVVDAMLEVAPELVNFVDNRNARAHRWLRWLGFTLDEPAPHGVERMLFRRFSRSAPCADLQRY